jgi:hypothetical protein
LKPADPAALCALIEAWQPGSDATAAEPSSEPASAKGTLYAFKRP